MLFNLYSIKMYSIYRKFVWIPKEKKHLNDFDLFCFCKALSHLRSNQC